MNTSSIDITVIIPNWNGEKWLPSCLDALHRQKYRRFRTIVIDNGSHDGSRNILKGTYPWVDCIFLPDNQGFASAVNAGIRLAKTRYVVLLNSDTIPSEDWLWHLHDAISIAPEGIGSLTSCMVKMDDPSQIDDAGDILSWFGSATKRGHGSDITEFNEKTEVFSPCAGAALYRRSTLIQTGLFDERFESYLEDVDLGLRLRMAGFRCYYIPQAVVMHKGHGSGMKKNRYIINMTRNRLLLFLKNIPFSLLLRNLHVIIAGQIWYAIMYRNPFASCIGYFLFIIHIPSVIGERRVLLRKTVLSIDQIKALLTYEKPG